MVDTVFCVMSFLICFVILTGCVMIGGWIIEDSKKDKEE